MALPVATLLTEIGEPGADDPRLRTTPLGAAEFAVLVVSIFYGYFAICARQLRAKQRAVQAQLKLLQGQMEPHFLFNTLANVVGLMEVDTARANAMLESFTDYLRASLRSLREGEQTLGAELDMIDAYLRVVKVRMEDRLHYRVDIADSLRPLQLPALSLQPLVENAIRRGLEPRIEGGERIAAHVADGALVISVTDDGLGLDAADQSKRRGTGTAFNNIRERLVQA
jgi:sensor histidine kinase YesM